MRPVLVVKHVPWEGPHRIADALTAAGLDLELRCPLAGDDLPATNEVSGALFMGGPMNVDQVEQYPALADEREWLTAAIESGMPVLGICLGSQLIARALGAEVRPGAAKEIGWLDVSITDPDDPLLGPLAPRSNVLHWHGDVLGLPEGASRLATSDATATQAFRYSNAWGVLFHAEADPALIDQWLAESSMAEEAEAVIGLDFPEQLLAGAERALERLVPDSKVMFEAFAELIVANGAD